MMMNAILCLIMMRGQIDDDDMMSFFSDVNVDYHVCMYVYLRALKSRKRTLVSDWIVDTDDAMSRVDLMVCCC